MGNDSFKTLKTSLDYMHKELTKWYLHHKFKNSDFQLEKNKIIRDAKVENTKAKREKRMLKSKGKWRFLHFKYSI